MYKKRSKDDPKKPKRVYRERDMTKDDWEKANRDYFGENNADWLSEKNERDFDRFEDEEGLKELDFDY
jgi:hypothetical protein